MCNIQTYPVVCWKACTRVCPDPCFRFFAYKKKNENIMSMFGYTLVNLSSPQNDLELLNCKFSYNNVTCPSLVANYFYLTIK